MGDRANVLIITVEGDAPLVLYTHWCGHALPSAVEVAIERAEPRWTDPSYMARIVVQSVLQDLGARPDDPLGFGLDVGLLGSEYPLLVIDIPEQRVGVAEEDEFYDLRSTNFARRWQFLETVPFETAAQPGVLEELRRRWDRYHRYDEPVTSPFGPDAPVVMVSFLTNGLPGIAGAVEAEPL